MKHRPDLYIGAQTRDSPVTGVGSSSHGCLSCRVKSTHNYPKVQGVGRKGLACRGHWEALIIIPNSGVGRNLVTE